LVSSPRKTGWLRDPNALRPPTYLAHRGTLLADVAPWSVKSFVQGTSDQKQLGACTAVSLVRLIQTYDAAQGDAAPVLGSALAAYWGGRIYDSGCATVAAFEKQDTDCGSTHASVCKAIVSLGLPPEDAWPYDDTNTGAATDRFRKRPDADAARLAFDARTLVFASLEQSDTTGTIVALNHAGAAGKPPGIGMVVDRTFVEEGFDPTVAYTPNLSDRVGGHALYLVSMRVNPTTGAREYELAMSWGAGPYAFVWISEAAVTAPTTQLTVVSRTPTVVAP
jgi:hypothetical protein